MLRPDPLGPGGPALDAVWDAMRETEATAGRPAFGRAAPEAVRVMRARDLVRWNDEPGRTRQDVLNLLDRAISHTIMAAVAGARR